MRNLLIASSDRKLKPDLRVRIADLINSSSNSTIAGVTVTTTLQYRPSSRASKSLPTDAPRDAECFPRAATAPGGESDRISRSACCLASQIAFQTSFNRAGE